MYCMAFPIDYKQTHANIKYMKQLMSKNSRLLQTKLSKACSWKKVTCFARQLNVYNIDRNLNLFNLCSIKFFLTISFEPL